jgi:ABC-type nitrate/sulfonate/bicarbonate transport system ATPase subunit
MEPSDGSSSCVALENVTVSLPMTGHGSLRSAQIFKNLSFKLSGASVVVIFGGNGSGKTTFLRLLAGLQEPTSGSVKINGRRPRETRVSMMFQNYRDTLLPWYSSEHNLKIGLQSANSSGNALSESQLLVRENILGSQFPLLKRPGALSGGQQQRLCLLRAIEASAEILLLDEPFSALDQTSKLRCQVEIEKQPSLFHKPVFLVVHDLTDAILLADRILLFGKTPLSELIDIQIPLERADRRRMIQTKSPEFSEIIMEVSSAVQSLEQG